MELQSVNIAIIDGGIGGLSMAVTLRQQGFTNVHVYEATPEIKPLGRSLRNHLFKATPNHSNKDKPKRSTPSPKTLVLRTKSSHHVFRT